MNTFENLEFGLDTFGDLPRNAAGEIVSQAEAIRITVAEAVLADQVDVIAVGEHHRPSSSSMKLPLRQIVPELKNWKQPQWPLYRGGRRSW